MSALETVLRRLADERWRALRRHHNAVFMGEGPGPGWQAFKVRYAAEFDEIRLLQEYLGLKPE